MLYRYTALTSTADTLCSCDGVYMLQGGCNELSRRYTKIRCADLDTVHTLHTMYAIHYSRQLYSVIDECEVPD